MTRPAPHLSVVGSHRDLTARWSFAPHEATVYLSIAGTTVCEIAPPPLDPDHEPAVFAVDLLQPVRRRLDTLGTLVQACEAAARHFGVNPPGPDILARLVEATPALGGPAPATGLLERLADLLASILDEPLTTLPGADPLGAPGPTALRLAHFRPELSERAAALLEEAGR